MTYVVVYEDLQNRVKDSLDRVLRDCLKHDWLEDGINFSPIKYNTDMTWNRMVNEPMGKGNETNEEHRRYTAGSRDWEKMYQDSS